MGVRLGVAMDQCQWLAGACVIEPQDARAQAWRHSGSSHALRHYRDTNALEGERGEVAGVS